MSEKFASANFVAVTRHDPFAIPVKVNPDMLQILGVEVVNMKTPLPEPPETLSVVELPLLSEDGGEKFNGDCAVFPIDSETETVAGE